VLDFAGLAVPGSYQGHSLRPLLTDPQTKVRDGFIYEGTGGYGEAPRTFAWITERTKVIHTLGSKPDKQPAFIEIYDMKNDPDETNNLSSSPGSPRCTWKQRRLSNNTTRETRQRNEIICCLNSAPTCPEPYS